MPWYGWVFVLSPIALLLFLGIFGPNKVNGKPWRGHQKPSVMTGPDKRDPSEENRRY